MFQVDRAQPYKLVGCGRQPVVLGPFYWREQQYTNVATAQHGLTA